MTYFTTTTEVDTATDLANLTGRDVDSLTLALDKRYTDDEVAALCACSLDDVRALKAGVYHSVFGVDGVVAHPFPAHLHTKASQLLADRFAKVLGSCETNAPRVHGAAPVETVSIGEVRASDVSDIRSGLQGYDRTHEGRANSPLRQRQALESTGVSVASAAAAINVDPEAFRRWASGIEAPPLDDDGARFYKVMTFLSAGPTLSWHDGGHAVAAERF